MRGAVVIYRRELAGLFLTPLGWVLFFLALVMNGLFFAAYLSAFGGAVNEALAASLGLGTHFWLLLALLPPLLTMRMLSEEARSGMLEFLRTAPVSDGALIAGKAMAATTFMALLWGTSLVYGLTVQLLGAPPDWGQVMASYLGALLVSALFCSVGLLASAVTNTPLLAAFLAFLFNVGLIALSSLAPQLSGPFGDTVAQVTDKIDVMTNLQASFLIGVFDSAHLVFFVAWTSAFLVLATLALEARRWW